MFVFERQRSRWISVQKHLQSVEGNPYFASLHPFFLVSLPPPPLLPEVKSPEAQASQTLSPQFFEDRVKDRLHAPHISAACVCLCGAAVLVGLRASFVFLLILPGATQVSDLLGDKCSAAWEESLPGLSELSCMIIFTSNKYWVQEPWSSMQSVMHLLRGCDNSADILQTYTQHAKVKVITSSSEHREDGEIRQPSCVFLLLLRCILICVVVSVWGEMLF